MSRMLTSSLIVICVVLLFHFSGLLSDTLSPTGYVLATLGLTHPEDFSQQQIWILIGSLSLLAVGGLIVTTLSNQSFDSWMFTIAGYAFVTMFLGLGWDLILIFQKINEISNMLAVMIISPLIFAWIVTLYDWLRGNDT